MKQQTPLEEQFKEAIFLGGLSSVNKNQDAINCAKLAEQIAIGFSKWKDNEVYISIQDYEFHSPYAGKTDSELFSMYMESRPAQGANMYGRLLNEKSELYKQITDLKAEIERLKVESGKPRFYCLRECKLEKCNKQCEECEDMQESA